MAPAYTSPYHSEVRVSTERQSEIRTKKAVRFFICSPLSLARRAPSFIPPLEMLSFFHKDKRSSSKCMWEGELRVERKLGEGAYGDVLLVRDSNTEYFAAKIASTASTAATLLQNEYKIYKHLGCCGKRTRGLPKIHAFGYDPHHDYNVLVMNRLGASLRDVMKMNDNSLPTYSVLRIASQVIRSLQYIHGCGVIHGDIKPRNILCARKCFGRIYVVDFGLATFYREGRTNRLTEITTGKTFQGTVDFASRHTHRGISLSRRDDLESLAFTLVFLMKGLLPWTQSSEDEYLMNEDMSPPKNIDHLDILAHKERIPIEELCQGLSPSIQSFMRYAYDLEFYDEPDYPFMIELFEDGMRKLEDIGDVDNGDKLDIWPDLGEKQMFMGQREEDDMWEKQLEFQEQRRKAGEGNEKMTAQEFLDEAEPQQDDQQSEKDEMGNTTFPFVGAFKSWNPFASPQNEVDKRSTSETCKIPVIGPGRIRKTLFGKIRRVLKLGPQFQTIILKGQEDSWSGDWSLENEYRAL